MSKLRRLKFWSKRGTEPARPVSPPAVPAVRSHKDLIAEAEQAVHDSELLQRTMPGVDDVDPYGFNDYDPELEEEYKALFSAESGEGRTRKHHRTKRKGTQRKGTKHKKTKRKGTKHKGTKHKGTKHKGTKHKGTKRKGTQRKGTKKKKNNTGLNGMFRKTMKYLRGGR